MKRSIDVQIISFTDSILIWDAISREGEIIFLKNYSSWSSILVLLSAQVTFFSFPRAGVHRYT